MRQLTLWIIAFIICISTSGDSDKTKIGTRKAKAMALGPRRYDMVAKADKHQSPDSEDHEANTIGMCDMESRADTCCVGNKWSLLSTIGQLCIVNHFTIHMKQSPMYQWVEPQHQCYMIMEMCTSSF